MVRVLLVEDSAVTLEYLGLLLSQDRGLEVVATARDGVEAVEKAERLHPDVILMDVHMPRLGGLEATRQIMAQVPTPIVLITASLDPGETELGFESIKAGALTLVGKPGGLDSPEGRELIRTVKLMAEVKVVRRWPVRTVARDRMPRPVQRVDVVAIGASTGGPATLAEILAGLRSARALPPILVVQHITPGFSAGLAEWLGKESGLPVRLAKTGQRLAAGVVHVAPDGMEMGIGADARIVLSRPPSNDGSQPTVDHLFESVAASHGRCAMGILLTGMGRDGAAGLRRLREAGAITVAQDEATSVIFGMPGEAIRLGAAEHVLSPRDISRLILTIPGTQEGR
ncbi:MAG TPA: chemotaxis protein CheB [Vicinamibacteria bacterium]|nr:chemotaxis protein CheB [Vicinamibacteria bacterium]